ncbi:MAG: ABC transporter permease [Alphaproteobacteria bacterium]
MSGVAAFFDFIAANRRLVGELALQHAVLTLSAVGLATILGVAMGVVATRYVRIGHGLLVIANIAQAVPSIAVLGLMIPLLGIGFVPALFALYLRALLPIFLNTYLGIRHIEPATVEAARGIGMRPREVLGLVELPLAAPIIIAGVRTAAVEGVAIATLAAFIGAGGLGDLILQGIALLDTPRLLAGAVPAALMAVGLELLLARFEQSLKTRFWHGLSPAGA